MSKHWNVVDWPSQFSHFTSIQLIMCFTAECKKPLKPARSDSCSISLAEWAALTAKGFATKYWKRQIILEQHFCISRPVLSCGCKKNTLKLKQRIRTLTSQSVWFQISCVGVKANTRQKIFSRQFSVSGPKEKMFHTFLLLDYIQYKQVHTDQLQTTMAYD